MTEFKKGDRVLVPCVVERVLDEGVTLKVCTEDTPVYFFQHASGVTLAPDQPLKEGDRVVTLGGSFGFIRAIYKDEAYVVLLNDATRRSVTCTLSHLRRPNPVDVTA